MENQNKLYLTSKEEVCLDINYRYKIRIPTFQYVTNKGCKITLMDNWELFCKDLQFEKDILIKIIGKNYQ